MACFPIRRCRRVDDSFDQLVGDQLDFFDPWHDFEKLSLDSHVKSGSFRWIHQPQRSTNTLSLPINDEKPRQPARQPTNTKKFRLLVNINGFDPQTVSTRIDGQRVIIEGKQEDRPDVDNYQIQTLNKIFDLPDYTDLDHLISYITPNSMVVIEVPICHPRSQRRPSLVMNDEQNVLLFGQYREPSYDYISFLTGTDFQPRLIEKGDGQKQLEMLLDMKTCQPEEIRLLLKNNRLIVRTEQKSEDNQRTDRSFLFKSTLLPPGTQVDQLKCQLTNEGQLKLEGPFIELQEPTPSD